MRPSLAMRESARLAGSKPALGLDRAVAVRLLADQQDGHRAFAPQREVEGHPAQHGDDDVQHFRGNRGKIDDGHGLAVHGNAEQGRENVDHVVAHRDARKHEAEARVGLQRLEPRLQPHVGRDVRRLVELSRGLVEEARQFADAVRHRRVLLDVIGLVGVAGRQALCRLDQLAEDGALDLPVPAAAEHDFLEFLEGEEPIGQIELAWIEHERAESPKARAYSLCMSSSTIWPWR